MSGRKTKRSMIETNYPSFISNYWITLNSSLEINRPLAPILVNFVSNSIYRNTNCKRSRESLSQN